MTLEEFNAHARAVFEGIPERYRRGVDGLTVSAEAVPHPSLPDVYTLGHCLTESYPSEWVGPETTRSRVVLYHGSFRRLARLDPDFDWEGEIWETITHELRHHLESLSETDDLGGVDYAMDEAFKRDEGLDFDPWYYQHGDRLGPGLYEAEGNFFIERAWSGPGRGAEPSVEFHFGGADYRVPAPEDDADVHYLWIDGVDVGNGSLQLVLVKKRRLGDRLRRLFRGGGTGLLLYESETTAEPA